MGHPRMFDDADPLLAVVRRSCLALPEAREQESWGRPVFFAGRRVFARYGIAGADDRRVVVRPDDDERPALLAHPRVTVPPYVGPSGWIGLDVGGSASDGRPPVDWTEVGELIEDSYRRVALVRMLRVLDARPLRPDPSDPTLETRPSRSDP